MEDYVLNPNGEMLPLSIDQFRVRDADMFRVSGGQGKVLLTITPDHRLVLGEGVTVDEAAAGFVEAVNRMLNPAGPVAVE